MAGRRGLIMGVANHRSIAWAIAQACAAQGAELAFTFQGEALEKRVRPLAASVGSEIVLPCDVGDDAQIDATFDALKERWGELDFLVHAIGFANKDYLRGRFIDTPQANVLQRDRKHASSECGENFVGWRTPFAGRLGKRCQRTRSLKVEQHGRLACSDRIEQYQQLVLKRGARLCRTFSNGLKVNEQGTQGL